MPWTKSFDRGFPAKSYLTTNSNRINLCSRSWGHMGKGKGKGEVETDGKRKRKRGQVEDKKMSAFCLLRKAIGTSRVAHFSPHLTSSSWARACCHEWCRREDGVCRRDTQGCGLQLLQRCMPRSKQLVSGWGGGGWSSESLVSLNPARLLIRIQSHCTWQWVPQGHAAKGPG